MWIYDETSTTTTSVRRQEKEAKKNQSRPGRVRREKGVSKNRAVWSCRLTVFFSFSDFGPVELKEGEGNAGSNPREREEREGERTKEGGKTGSQKTGGRATAGTVAFCQCCFRGCDWIGLHLSHDSTVCDNCITVAVSGQDCLQDHQHQTKQQSIIVQSGLSIANFRSVF